MTEFYGPRCAGPQVESFRLACTDQSFLPEDALADLARLARELADFGSKNVDGIATCKILSDHPLAVAIIDKLACVEQHTGKPSSLIEGTGIHLHWVGKAYV